jgi:hypothetical protein
MEKLDETHHKSLDEKALDDSSLLVHFSKELSTDKFVSVSDQNITMDKLVSPDENSPGVAMIDNKILRFNELLNRNRRSNEFWNAKTLEDVYPILNNTARLTNALIQAEAVCLVEMRLCN